MRKRTPREKPTGAGTASQPISDRDRHGNPRATDTDVLETEPNLTTHPTPRTDSLQPTLKGHGVMKGGGKRTGLV